MKHRTTLGQLYVSEFQQQECSISKFSSSAAGFNDAKFFHNFAEDLDLAIWLIFRWTAALVSDILGIVSMCTQINSFSFFVKRMNNRDV